MFFANHIFVKIMIVSLLLLSFVEQSLAISLPFRLSWTRNRETDLAFYTIYYGTSSRNYTYSADVDKQNYTFLFHEDLLASNRLSIGSQGLNLYIALTATDYSLNESGYSTELAVFVEPPTTTTTIPGSVTTIPATTTTSVPSVPNTFCSSDPELYMKGTPPQEGTLSVNITDDPASAISASLILTLDDPDVKGEGYIYINGNGPIDLPVGDYDLLVHTFEVPINPDWLVQGNNSFRFTHVDTYGYEVKSLCIGLQYLIPNQKENCSTGSLYLKGVVPQEGTLSVNITDDPASAISASLILTLDDPDVKGEGYIYINGNGPIDLPVGDYDLLVHTFEVPINPDWLVQGNNSFRFTHVDTYGYEVRELCLLVTFSRSSVTTTIPRPSTTTIPVDTTPPTGSITINQGESTTNSRQVTLNLSAEDDESGMGAGAQMMLSNDNEKWFGPKPFAPIKTWILTPKEGIKTVYAKFCDEAGNWMEEPVTDSIEVSFSCSESSQLEPTAKDCSGKYLTLWSHEKAVDGNDATGWLSRMRRVMQEEYIILDLGGVKVINRIDISSKRFIGRDLFPRDFKVQASADMQNWTDVVTEQDYTLLAARSDSWFFDGTEAGYVKFVATRPQKFMFFYYLTYISEIEVYGCAEPEVPDPESLASAQSADQARSLLSEEAFDRELAGKKGQGSVIEGAAPGRPGKPLFILKENE